MDLAVILEAVVDISSLENLMNSIGVSTFTGRNLATESLYTSSFFTLNQGKGSSIQNYYRYMMFMGVLAIVCVLGAIICHVILTQRIYQPKHKCGMFCGDRVMSCRRFFFVKFMHLLLLEGACFILINSIMDFFILDNAGFYVISVLGFLLFAALLIALPVHYCCCRKWESKLSKTALGIYYDGLKATNFLRTPWSWSCLPCLKSRIFMIKISYRLF